MSDRVGQVWELTIEHRSGMFLVVGVYQNTKLLSMFHLEEGNVTHLDGDVLTDAEAGRDRFWRRIS